MILIFDVTQLSALLFLTGGLQNPFALLILVPVTIAATALRTESMQFLEFQRERSGEIHHYEARIVVSGVDEVLAILRDITRRKRMEASLRDSEQRFRSLIENGSDLIAILRPSGEIRYGSPSVLRILGYGTEEITGRSFEEFAHLDDIHRVEL